MGYVQRNERSCGGPLNAPALAQNCCKCTAFSLAGLPEIEIPAERQEFLSISTYAELGMENSCTFASFPQILTVRKRKSCNFAGFSTLKHDHSPLHNRAGILSCSFRAYSPRHTASPLPVHELRSESVRCFKFIQTSDRRLLAQTVRQAMISCNIHSVSAPDSEGTSHHPKHFMYS